ncbi:MAG: phage tail protein [Rubrivivax sp.]|nr:MAG: phage tail protein [Rubrivivax sp.]
MAVPPAPPLPPAARPSARVTRPPAARPAGATGAPPSQGPQGKQAEALYPPPAFHFAVTFGANAKDADGAFREVTGLGPEMETESVVEGGQNAFVHQLPKAVKHPKLVLSRGIATMESRLLLWCQSVLEGGLAQPIFPKQLHVFLLDEQGGPLRVWSVQNAYPVKWSVEAFQATRNEVAIERIELAYAGSSRLM